MKIILNKIKKTFITTCKNFVIFLLVFSIPTQIFAASVISNEALKDAEILESNIVIQQYFPKGSVTITATDTLSTLSWINPNQAFKNDLGPEQSLSEFTDFNSTVLNFKNGIENQISEPLEIPLSTSSMDSVLETENLKTELKDPTLNKTSEEQKKITDGEVKSSSTEITAWTQEIILVQTDLDVENKKEEPVSQIEEQRNSTTTNFYDKDLFSTNQKFKALVSENADELSDSENESFGKTPTSTETNLVYDDLLLSTTTQEIITTSTPQSENLISELNNPEIILDKDSEIIPEKQSDPIQTYSKISSPKLEYFNFSSQDLSLLDFETLSSFALNLSLASKKTPGAVLLVEYQTTSTTWQSLVEIDLTKGVSNLQNNGFINIPLSKALFEFVSELKIRLSYQLPFEFKGENQDLLFLDSVWLETRYEQEKGELTDTELLEMSPKLLDPEGFLKMSFSNEALDLSLPGNLDNPIVFSGNNTLNQSPKLQMVMAGTRPSTTAERLDNKVAYKEAFLNTDVEYEITESGLKEAIVLKNKNHPSRFRYLLNLDEFDYIQESDSKIQLYEKGYKGKSLKLLYVLSAPYMIDSEGEISKSLKFAVNKNLLTLTPDKNWLKTAVYPVVVDPTVEIQVLNIHSQPVAGEYWNVDFTTVGTENLIITPADQATVNDMQFATLTCGEEDRTSGAQILEGDIIFYPNWNCSEVATVSHLDLRTANHKLNFQFGDASAEAFNAAYVWDGGGGDAQWTTAANWSSDIVPGSSDTATFDNTCVTNCSPTIATTTTIAGLTMSAGYTGTLTQGNGYTFTVIGNFTMASGTFVGGSSTTTFTDYFTISGGTFVSASSTVFGPADGGGRIININSSQTFERLQFNNSVGNYSRTITSGDTLIVTGDLILSDGSLNTGTVEARGSVRILSGFDGGTTALTFGGSATQTFDLTGATGIFNGDITVNKSGGEVQLVSALTLDAASQDLNIVEGAFNINGYNLTVNGSSGTLIVQDGGTFKLQGGETITTNSSYPEFQSGSTAIYSTSSSVSIKDYNYKHLTLSGGGTYTATSSTLNIAGNFFNDASTFTHNNGTVNLNGVDQYIFGTSTYYNLTKSSTTAATLYFSATSTQTIANTLTLTGASGGVLSIRSTASGTQARIDSQATESISYLDVKDSYNINASDINAQSTYSTDSGNNEGWIFEAVISQGDYRFYENINQLQPTVDIGALNSSVVIISTSSPIRLRMNLLVSDYNLSTTTSNFKLQVSSYTNSNWNDVSINPDEWYDHSWLNRRKIVFNNSSATENLTDFPVLVNLNESSNIDYSKTQNSGQDIRFVDSDGSTLLNYEIEKWDETSTSTVWVKVPQISSASSTDYIWMYYNNPGATDNSTTTGVWDSGFRFVHHLNDTTATTTIDDSTSNNIIGTKLSTTEPNATSTEISDGAQYFDGSNDRVIINDATDPTAYTISAWIKPVDATAINIFVRTTSAGPGAAWSHQLRMNATGTIESYTFDGGTKTVFGTTVLTPSNWYYVTAVAQNSGNMRVYLNGVEEGTAASIATLWTGGDRYYFGSNSASGMGFFSGVIDELRFSSSVRSPSWIQAEYKNGAGIFSTFETEQSATSTQWNFYNNASVTSSTTISTVLLPSSDILGSYQEGNPTALNPFAVNAGQYIEYDWVLDPSNVVLGATYYFRMVYSDGTVLDSYANLPELSLISDNAPNSPTSLGPSTVVGGSWINDNTPTFTFNLTDPDVGNTVRYKIEISTSSSFSTLLLDYTSATATQGSASFTVGQATSTGTYTTGTTGQVLSDSSDGYYWRVKTIDNLGANSSYATANSGAVAFKLDTVVPTAGSLTLATTSPTSLTATISGASDSLSGLATASYVFNNSTTGTNSSATSALSWLSSGLTPNTPYTFYADVFDVAGNYASTVTISIYTLANLPTSLSLNQDSQTQLTASWNANSNPAGTEYYVLNATASTSPDWSSSTSQIFSGLTCGTSYDFVVKARNSSDIETAYTSTTTQSTAACSTLDDEGSGGGGGGGGGGGVPTPLEGGFGVVINAGASTTVDSLTTLTLQATADTAYMAISNTPDFKNAVLQLFTTSTQWNLCEQKTCRAGFYTVYVKYFNSQMQAKQTVSSGIQLLVKDKTPTPNPPLVENLPLAAILTVSKDRKIWSDKLVGEEPLNNVSLRVAVSGTAKGQITYEYDCTNDGIYELTRRTTNEFVTHRNVCNFAKAGAYTIRVKVTRGVNSVESFASVLVEPAEDALVNVVEPQVSPPVVVIENPPIETPVVVVPQNTPPVPDASPGPLSNNLPLANLFENISSSVASVSEGLVSGLSSAGNFIKDTIVTVSKTSIQPLEKILKQGSTLFLQEFETKLAVSVSALVVAPSSLVMEYSLAKYGLLGNFTNLTEFWLHIVATLQGLMSSFGLRRRRRYWGTVYDSVTKQPLDPVIVEMINFETGKVTEQAITDLSGRFGFMDKPGNFLIKAKKTNYQFPSVRILGKMDGVFDNLYHGELMQITKSGEVLSPNIPMDPLAFDWNQTGKLKYVNFHPRLETFFHVILEIIFWGSASFSLLTLLLKPNLFGLIFVSVFGLLFVLKRFIPHRKLWGSLTSQNHPTHFLIIEISPKSIPSVVLGKAMTNEKGRFFLKAPKGEYILRVMQTVEDKVILLKNQIIKVDNQGVVNQNISLDD